MTVTGALVFHHHSLFLVVFGEEKKKHCKISITPFFHIYSFLHIEENSLWKTLRKKVKLLMLSNFTFFHNVFYAICILKSFKCHISVVVCSFFEFGTVSKWRIRNWVKLYRKTRQTIIMRLHLGLFLLSGKKST